MIEHFFQCPYCSEAISMLLDGSVPYQEYVEDCEICCNPITLRFRIEQNEVIEFDAQAM